MADYYPLLKRAVSGLADASPANRQAIYERARKALLGQLNAIQPPVAPEDIARESGELDAAIAKLEADLFPETAVPAPPDPIVPPSPAAPSLVAEAATLPETKKAVEPAPPVPGLVAAPAETIPAKASPDAEVLAPDLPSPEREIPASFEAAPEIPDAAAIVPEPRLRPREPQRPLAPMPPAPRGQYRRVLILGAVVAAVVALVAAAALKLRNSPDELARLKPVAAPTVETNAGGKIVERVGGDAASPAPATSAPTPAPAASAPSVSADAGATETAPAANTPAATVTQAPIPVATRSALLVEAPDLDSKLRTFIGSAIWRLDNVPAGAGQPLGTSVHADIDIPEAKVRVTLDIRKNTDAALPASNTIEVRFTLAPGAVIPGISQISVPQMRREDNPNGDVLAGVPVKITDTYFLVGLAQGDIASRNGDLMRNRGWIDIPIQLTDNRIAKLTIEKGATGDRILADALTTWSQ